jgi:pimeloyl-ACP methyl ester carboxylesterase
MTKTRPESEICSYAAGYLEKLRAPAKRVVWFENSAHNVPFEEPDRFNTKVVEELRSIGVTNIR